MASRRKSRQRALQILFMWDTRKQAVADAARTFFETLYAEEGQPAPRPDAFAQKLVNGVAENAEEIDRKISERAEHWRMERMLTVDRNILRLAVYELMHMDTPAPVVIDEALELARRYSNEESVQFVNGVLDAIHRDLSKGSGATGAPPA